MLPYLRKLKNEGPPHAVMGFPKSVEPNGAQWIELIVMVFKNTMDNQDKRGSGKVVSTSQAEGL